MGWKRVIEIETGKHLTVYDSDIPCDICGKVVPKKSAHLPPEKNPLFTFAKNKRTVHSACGIQEIEALQDELAGYQQ